MNRKMVYNITEADFKHKIIYTAKTIDESFEPIADEIAEEHSNKKHPYCIGISGPPGSGKSSISALLHRLFHDRGIESQVLPLDGFHLKNEELKKRKVWFKNRLVSLYEIKGSKESYDVKSLLKHLERLKQDKNFYWPIYSRQLHDPIKDGIYIENKDAIYILEGNYLLLDLNPWNSIPRYFDKKVFIKSPKLLLKKRIIKRKNRGGYSKREAKEHYRFCDSHNIDEVLRYSRGYDYLLIQKGRYNYTLNKISQE